MLTFPKTQPVTSPKRLKYFADNKILLYQQISRVPFKAKH